MATTPSTRAAIPHINCTTPKMSAFSCENPGRGPCRFLRRSRTPSSFSCEISPIILKMCLQPSTKTVFGNQMWVRNAVDEATIMLVNNESCPALPHKSHWYIWFPSNQKIYLFFYFHNHKKFWQSTKSLLTGTPVKLTSHYDSCQIAASLESASTRIPISPWVNAQCYWKSSLQPPAYKHSMFLLAKGDHACVENRAS